MQPQSSKSDIMDLFPTYLKTQSINADYPKSNPAFSVFNVHQSNFAQLADKTFIEKFKPELIGFSIQDEINQMTPEHQLEITVPVLGLVDLLPNSLLQADGLQFAPPIAINGYIAAGAPNISMPYPDFILATDIAGNQFEILVNHAGKIELPEEGTGLFSMLSYLTFIFSSWQVKDGNGLENGNDLGLKPGFVYLLPPAVGLDFNPKVALTHFNDENIRLVDTLREVDIQFKPPLLQTDIEVQTKHSVDIDNAIEVKLGFHGENALKSGFAVKLALETLNDSANFTLQSPHSPVDVSAQHGWQQDPFQQNIFTKYFGLSEESKMMILRDIYSEADMTRDYLTGDRFGISQTHHYNNFLLFPEMLGKLYDALSHGIVNQQISSEVIWSRVSDEALLNWDFAHLPISEFESTILSSALTDSSSYPINAIKNLFDSNDGKMHYENLTLFTDHAIQEAPKAHAEILTLDGYANNSQYDPADIFAFDQPDHANLFSISASSNGQPTDDSLLSSLKQGADATELHFSDIISTATTDTLAPLTDAAASLHQQAGSVFGSEGVQSADFYYVAVPSNSGEEWHLGFVQTPNVDG